MEHPSKRRRVERSVARPAGNDRSQIGRGRSGSLTEKKEKRGFTIPKLELPSHEDQAFDTLLRFPRQKIQQLYDPLKSSEHEPKRLLTRGIVPTQVNSNLPARINNVAQPVAQPVSTVVSVAVSDGKENLSNVVVPLASTPVAIPGFSGLTMAPVATPRTADKVKSSPGDATPPAAVAASEARAAVIQTQQAIAHEYVALSQAPAANATPENRAAASQSPMAINVPSSQQVLSSPSTPIPSTPQSLGSPSSSYFSSSPASVAASSSPTSDSPTTSPTLNSSNSNFTTSATTMSGSGASASMSMTSLSSEASAMSASLSAQASASEASINSMNALATLASASQNPSGFATATRTGQSISGMTSGQMTSSPTSLSASASSQLSQSSASAASGTATSGTGFGVSGVGGTSATGTSTSPTSSSGAGSGGSSAPPVPQLVGGVVGGIAGLAMILFFIIILFRWRRKKLGQRRNIPPPIPQTIGPGGVPQTGTMTQRSSTAPIAAAGFFGRLRPVSSQTAATAATAATVATTDTAPSERGFQKISGRKLTSVLASGGDGYGDPPINAGPSTATAGPSDRGVGPGQGPFVTPPPAIRTSPAHSLSGSSFYRDSHGFYGGVVPANDQSQTETSSSPSSPTYPAPLAAATRRIPPGRGSPSRRPEEVANMRPGPARTPVINQPGQVPVRTPSRATPPGRPMRNTPPPISEFPQIPSDGLRRSHPSQDGSRGPRFREDTTPP